MVLLHLTLTLPKSIRPRISVFHFDHGLRGRQSKAEGDGVESFCREHRVDFHRGRAATWKHKKNLHDRARRLRYEFFFSQAATLGIAKIATAHQADDQVETSLIHWIQGAGLKGLAGIPLSRDYRDESSGKTRIFQLIRPLIFLTRREIADYAKSKKLKFFRDPSNKDRRYLRSRVRSLVNALEKENPQFIERTAKNTYLLQEDEAFLEQTTERLFYEGVDIIGGTQSGSWGCRFDFFRDLPRALQYRILQKIIREIGGETLSFDRIVTMLKFLETSLDPSGKEKTFSLPGMILRKEKSRFYFSK